MENIYFDYNATTPIDSFVLEQMEPFLRSHFGNPASFHAPGRLTQKAIKKARHSVAELLDAESDSQIVFTSGGTESINAAICSALAKNPDKTEIITSSVEHSSVKNLVKKFGKRNYRVHEVSVDGNGLLNVGDLKTKLSEKTALVTVMMSNNETGVLMPISEIAAVTEPKGIPFHVDAVQSVGKQKISAKELPADFISLAAHKFYGPKGVGALFIRDPKGFDAFVVGGSQERGNRAGTENVPGIVGLGAACDLLNSNFDKDIEKLESLRDYFEEQLEKNLKDIRINGTGNKRLANTSNVTFFGADGEALLFALDAKGIYASSGSACKSGAREPSHVLKGMGLSDEDANSSVRFSFGKFNTKNEIDRAVPILCGIVENLRKIALEEQHQH